MAAPMASSRAPPGLLRTSSIILLQPLAFDFEQGLRRSADSPSLNMAMRKWAMSVPGNACQLTLLSLIEARSTLMARIFLSRGFITVRATGLRRPPPAMRAESWPNDKPDTALPLTCKMMSPARNAGPVGRRAIQSAPRLRFDGPWPRFQCRCRPIFPAWRSRLFCLQTAEEMLWWCLQSLDHALMAPEVMAVWADGGRST